MILATDTYYYENKAKVVGVLFNIWEDANPFQIISTYVENVANYESGSFYKRELPCIAELLKQVDLNLITTIIVDGYVYLNDDGKHGLGYYLYEYLNKQTPVIGVAKTSFHDNKLHVAEVVRGNSKNPLYITSVGVDLNEARNCIKNMHGNYRMPTLLKLLDQHTRIE